MKYLFYLLIMTQIVFSRKDVPICEDLEILNTLFAEMQWSDREKYFEVEVGYKPTSFTLKYLDDYTELTKTEKQQLLAIIKEDKEPVCEVVNQAISKLGKNKKYNEDGSYIRFSFSWPITVSDRKKCIFLISSIKNINHGGGKVIGNEMLYVFEKQKKDKWGLSAKRAIAEY